VDVAGSTLRSSTLLLVQHSWFNLARRSEMGVTVEFENDRIRVLRSRHSGSEQHPAVSRGDRLIIYLDDGHVRRVDAAKPGQPEETRRKFGEVVWRNQSKHEISNLKDTGHEVIIVELK
jgi:hypothetical protein